jgi:dynein heavy chain
VRGNPTGAFTFDYRQAMLQDTWAPDAARRALPLTSPFSLQVLLTTDVEVAQWASEGLPGDELSVQNGLLTTRANRWPLCIDPQVGAASGARGMEASGQRHGPTLVVGSNFTSAGFP